MLNLYTLINNANAMLRNANDDDNAKQANSEQKASPDLKTRNRPKVVPRAAAAYGRQLKITEKSFLELPRTPSGS